jgi:hypothetical protein
MNLFSKLRETLSNYKNRKTDDDSRIKTNIQEILPNILMDVAVRFHHGDLHKNEMINSFFEIAFGVLPFDAAVDQLNASNAEVTYQRLKDANAFRLQKIRTEISVESEEALVLNKPHVCLYRQVLKKLDMDGNFDTVWLHNKYNECIC